MIPHGDDRSQLGALYLRVTLDRDVAAREGYLVKVLELEEIIDVVRQALTVSGDSAA